MKVTSMKQKGIGLIILIISIAILFLLAGSGYYFSFSGKKSILEGGNDAIQQTKELKKVFELYDEQIEKNK